MEKLRRVRVDRKGRVYEGVLLPSTDRGFLVLKLDSGYNIGIEKKGAKVEELGSVARPEEKEEKAPGKAEISIVGMGGTVSSKVEYKTGAVFPTTRPSDLMKHIPGLHEIASFRAREVFAILSEDMNPLHWAKAADAIKEEIESGAQGVLVLHGTDTMHYTSAALSFMLQDLPVPVYLVGAQRSSDRPSTDARLNILNAAYAAKNGPMANVGVCMHSGTGDGMDVIHLGTRVRKMHTTRRDAFHSINSGPLARVDYRKKLVEPLLPYSKRGGKLRFDNRASGNVSLFYLYPGVQPSIVSKLSDFDGVVLVGTGLGNAPTNAFNDKLAKSIMPEVKALVDSGIPVAMSSQCISGRIDLNVYTAGRMLQDAGVFGHLADWTPETAYAKMCWVLGHEGKMEKVREEMMGNIAGEITQRSELR